MVQTCVLKRKQAFLPAFRPCKKLKGHQHDPLLRFQPGARVDLRFYGALLQRCRAASQNEERDTGRLEPGCHIQLFYNTV